MLTLLNHAYSTRLKSSIRKCQPMSFMLFVCFRTYLSLDLVGQVLELKGVGVEQAVGPLVAVGDLDGGGKAAL
jgi:hypothetical protein